MVEAHTSTGSSHDHKINNVSGHATLPPLKDGVFEDIAKKFSTADIRTVYKFEKLLGGGHFGTVRLAHRISERFCCTIIEVDFVKILSLSSFTVKAQKPLFPT